MEVTSEVLVSPITREKGGLVKEPILGLFADRCLLVRDDRIVARRSRAAEKGEAVGARLPSGMVAGAALGMILAVLFGFPVMMGLIYGAGIGIVASLLIPDRKPSSN